MSRFLFYILLAVSLSVSLPSRTSAADMSEIADAPDVDKVVITISESVLRVSGAAGMTMAIYNVTGGVPVMKAKIDSPDRRFDLSLPRGIYIVQVGKAVRKIVIK